MEEGTVAVTHFLTRLIMPIGLIAFFVGFFVTLKSFRGHYDDRIPEVVIPGRDPHALERRKSSFLERVGAGLCGTLAVALTVLLWGAFPQRRTQPREWIGVLLMTGIILLLAAPAVFWKTRYRMAGEGIATMAIAMIAFAAGFSIGFLFVPLVVLMIWVCIDQLRQSRPRRETIGRRVDSSP